MSDSPDPTREAADRLAIAELFHLYCDALDDKDWDRLQDVFSEDAEADWLGDTFSHGRDEIIAFVKNALATDEIATHHMVSNLSVQLEGDRARAAVKMRAHHAGVGRRAGKFEESLGTFRGRFVRTPRGWRCCFFEERIGVMLGDAEVFELSEAGG